MKLLIDIPEKIVTAIQNGEDYRYDIHTTIAQGIPYEPKDDLISRSDLKQMLPAPVEDEYKRVHQIVDNIPSVPDRSKGEWIAREDMDYVDENKVVHNHFECKECGLIHDFIDGHTSQYNFCPNCGAGMRKIEDEISDPVISAIQENNAKYNERPNIDFSRMSYDLGGSNKPNCVICDHFGKCEECEKREEE